MTTEEVTVADEKDAWNGIASGFDDIVTPLTIPLAEEALRRVDVREGMRFLDVAAGSGALSIPAARFGARVLGTDIAPTMVERLKARARAEKLDVDARVMDGCALELDDDTFDVAGSQNGVSLFPDLQRGLREMVRVTKPGGRVLIIGFADMAKAEMVTVPFSAVKQAIPDFPGLPMDPPPLAFQLGDPGRMRRALEEAGLSGVRVDTVDWPVQYQSARHALDVLASSNPVPAGILAGFTPAQTAAIEEVLDRALAERASESGLATLHTAVNVAVGTK